MLITPAPMSNNAVCRRKLTPMMIIAVIFSVISIPVRLDIVFGLRSSNKNILTTNPINDATDIARPSDLTTPPTKAPTTILIHASSNVGITTSILFIIRQIFFLNKISLNTIPGISRIHLANRGYWELC